MIRLASRFCGEVFLVAFLLVALPYGTFAQSTGGRINGRVTDPSGAVIADATITITNDATGVRDAMSVPTRHRATAGDLPRPKAVPRSETVPEGWFYRGHHARHEGH